MSKKFSANPEGVFKAKNLKRVTELYHKMSQTQRKNAEPFPNLKSVPPMPHNATPEQIEARKKIYKVITKELVEDLKN